MRLSEDLNYGLIWAINKTIFDRNVDDYGSYREVKYRTPMGDSNIGKFIDLRNMAWCIAHIEENK